MHLRFSKYQGTGNDFVMVDNRELRFVPDVSQVKYLCDRKFGIGSDGLILISNSDVADFDMDFYNPDGSKSFCGNGSRCAVVFATELGITNGNAKFTAIDGVHDAVTEGKIIRIRMRNVSGIETTGNDDVLNTGSPHYIKYVHDLEQQDLIAVAREIRYGSRFGKEGINVNLVEQTDASTIAMRTYERGVEDETLSCGTGVTAAAISFGNRNKDIGKVNVKTRGGDLVVTFENKGNCQFENIWLRGPAQKVFEGEVTL